MIIQNYINQKIKILYNIIIIKIQINIIKIEISADNISNIFKIFSIFIFIDCTYNIN